MAEESEEKDPIEEKPPERKARGDETSPQTATLVEDVQDRRKEGEEEGPELERVEDIVHEEETVDPFTPYASHTPVKILTPICASTVPRPDRHSLRLFIT